MLRDPWTRWRGRFPYDVLESAGITPQSNMREILDASFELMARGEMTPEARRAWDELRIAEDRMLVDFFLYPVDLSDALAAARGALEAALGRAADEADSMSLPDPGDPEVVAELLRQPDPLRGDDER